MNYNQILQYIVLWIKENHNNEITGDILQDVLVEIVQYVKEGSDNVDVDVQELQNQIDAISLSQEIEVFEGNEDPNFVPPPDTYSAPDFYVKTDTNDVFVYTGAYWFNITQYFNPAEHDLDEFKNESSNPYVRENQIPDPFDPTQLENAIQSLEENKVDKEAGKGLSDENFSHEEKQKLADIEEGAQVNVIPDWAADTSNPRRIDNKPTKTSDFINDGDTGVSPYAEIDDVQDAIDEVVSKSILQGEDSEETIKYLSVKEEIGEEPETIYFVPKSHNTIYNGQLTVFKYPSNTEAYPEENDMVEGFMNEVIVDPITEEETYTLWFVRGKYLGTGSFFNIENYELLNGSEEWE